MEKKTFNIVVPKHKAHEVKSMFMDITGKWPFSTEYWDDIYVQVELTEEERKVADRNLEMILQKAR